jgi:hypothetical protein
MDARIDAFRSRHAHAVSVRAANVPDEFHNGVAQSAGHPAHGCTGIDDDPPATKVGSTATPSPDAAVVGSVPDGRMARSHNLT